MTGFANCFGENVSLGTVLNLESVLKPLNAIRFKPTDINGALRATDGKESIYFDIQNGYTEGNEVSSGNIVLASVYKITATQDNFFFTGCKTGDIFVCDVVKTCDANNKVRLLTGQMLSQRTATKLPVNGVFDGVDDTFSGCTLLAQPTYIYFVFKQLASTEGARIIDGNPSNSGTLFQTATNRLYTYCGTSASGIIQATLNDTIILRILFNGANGRFQLNNDPIQKSSIGTANMNSLKIAGNIEFKEAIIVPQVPTFSIDKFIYNSLNTDWGVGKPDAGFNNGKLILTFDDNSDTLYTTVFPILVEKGIKATFYINSGTIGTGLTWAMVNEMHNAGMDIQGHTKNHLDLNTATEAQVMDQLNGESADFIANGLPAPTHLAYPWGITNLPVIEWVKQVRLTARNTGVGNVNKHSNKFLLPVFDIDNINDAGVITAKANLDKVKLFQEGVVYLSHGATETGAVTRVPTAKFIDLIDYALSINMDFITISELYEQMEH